MSDTRNRRILIVDDNPSIHDDFVSILAEQKHDDRLALEEVALFGEKTNTVVTEGFEVISAFQGQEALEIVTKAKDQGVRFALAFVDMRMPPGWDGVQTIEQLWTVDPDLQVVICTAYSDTSWEDTLRNFDKTDQLLILKKPFDTAEVQQLARALTEKWHLARHAHLKLSQLTTMVEERTAELTKTNEQLKQSEERYSLAASGANDGLWDWDMVKDQIYYAPRWREMLGSESIPETSDAWFKLLHPDDQERVPARIKTFLEGTEKTYKTEYRILHGDGQYRWMMARGRVLRDTQGKALRFTGSQTDITDRKLAEDQLNEAYKNLKSTQSQMLQREKMASIGQIAAGVAHEINTPTGFMISNLRTLKKFTERLCEFTRFFEEMLISMNFKEIDQTLQEKKKHLKIDYIMEDLGNLVTETLEGAERIKTIVQNLKTFSRLDEKQSKMDDINAGIESTSNILSNEIRHKAVIKKDLGKIPLTLCNLGQLNQVFMNIILNAAQSIDNQGEILITSREDNGIIVVTFSDTGSGIPPEILSRIFEPFFTTKDIGQGTGLGLSIVYDIVRDHHGDITADSTLGKGTTFTIKIPIVHALSSIKKP